MEKKALVLTGLVVGLIGLLSVATGFAAEATRIKPDKEGYLISMDKCAESPAFGLGVTSALSLLVAQLILSISSGCICCMKGPHPSGSKWIISILCFVISWITFVLAFILLLGGAILNGSHSKQKNHSIYDKCYAMKTGIFSGATVLSIVTLLLGMLYFFIINFEGSSVPPPQANIAMGQPQLSTPPPPPPQKTGHSNFVV